MRVIYRFLLSMPQWGITPLFFLFLLFIPNMIGNVIITVVPSLSDIPNIPELDSFYLKVIMVLIVAPILETIVFQLILFSILKYIFHLRTITILALSSIIFGVVHCYNVLYIIVACVAGFLFMFLFIILNKRNLHPLLITILVHFLLNAITAVYDTQI